MKPLYPLRNLLRATATLALWLACAAEAPPPPDVRLDGLRARLPELQSRIEAWRGARFLHPVEIAIREPEQEHIAGWYEASGDRLYVAPRAEGRFLEGVLLHELVHALQDQRFDIDATRARLGADEEALDAFAALVEGEAMLAVVELLHYDFEKHASRARPESASPEPTGPEAEGRKEALFLYGDGLRFVRSVREAGGWPGVDAAFRAPPRTREQVLEPGRYLESTR